jgi:hypothetical protein
MGGIQHRLVAAEKRNVSAASHGFALAPTFWRARPGAFGSIYAQEQPQSRRPW